MSTTLIDIHPQSCVRPGHAVTTRAPPRRPSPEPGVAYPGVRLGQTVIVLYLLRDLCLLVGCVLELNGQCLSERPKDSFFPREISHFQEGVADHVVPNRLLLTISFRALLLSTLR